MNEPLASVLVVDDSPDSLDLMKEILGAHYRVRLAIGGEPALKLARQSPPDIVLLDVMMPGLDGYEVCRQLKADPSLAEVPVIFISALYEVEDEERGFKVGAVDYITKPISPPLVRARVATHLKLSQQRRQLDQAREKAEQAAHTRGEFLAFMSHEIRTPLTGILGTLGLLTETRLDPEQKGYLQVIRSSGEALLVILNDVLDVTKIDAGKLAIERRPFHLAEAVEGVVALMDSRAREKGLGLAFTMADGVPPVVEGDSMRLTQILLNLVGNAVKFTSAGTVAVDVAPGPSGRLVFRVSDSGIGIAPDALPTLFSDFTQQDASIGRRFGGTGLGLSICKKLVGLMDGTISVTSTPGVGSVFEVVLPLPVAQDTPAVAPAPQEATETPIAILVADDNPVNQRVALAMLSSRGHAVTLVPDGESAIRALEQGSFDLVLMDVRMRGIGGLEAVRRIRQLDGAAARIPVIALTGAASDQDRAQCLAAGMDDVVVKPYSRATLIDAIRRLI
jgi:signal transduction histidine kinase